MQELSLWVLLSATVPTARSGVFLMPRPVWTGSWSLALWMTVYRAPGPVSRMARMTFYSLFSTLFWPLFCEPVLVTRATKKEYSSELGLQNGSKMEPKMEPK